MIAPTFTIALLLAGVQVNPATAPAPVAIDQATPAPTLPVAPPAVLPPVAPTQVQTPKSAPAPDADQNDIIVTARPRVAPGDPLGNVNAQSFEATQAVDRAFIGPVSLAYKHTVPAPVRSGVRNFLNNLREPTVFVNYLLQLKPGKAAETLGRFTINSTIGAAGLVDMAKRRPFNLPRRPNGFADTLGYYGVGPGPFLFLPLVGPTTVRDLIGGGLDRLILPTAVGTPFNKLAYTIPTGVLSALDHRAEFDEDLNRMRDETANPYASLREYYLKKRRDEIDGLRGRHPATVTPVTAPVVAPVPTVATPVPVPGERAPTIAPAPPVAPDVR